MTGTKPKHSPARRSAGEEHPVTPSTSVMNKDESKNKKLSSPKPKHRLHYDQIREPRIVCWSRDEYGKRIMNRSPEADKKRLVAYDAFGFFGPEHADKPTIVNTGMETPTVIITPPVEEIADEHDESLRAERAKYLRSRLWLQERKKRETNDLKIVERRELALPPLQSNEIARISNDRDNEEREKRRVEGVLSNETIEALTKGD